MFYQQRLGHNCAGAARAHQPDKRTAEVDDEKIQVTHVGIVTNEHGAPAL
jgi:hypothetical protein